MKNQTACCSTDNFPVQINSKKKEFPSLPVAVIGAGPIGIAAAAHLAKAGEKFIVLEAGPSVGHHVLEWGHVQLFSPWQYNIDKAARELLEKQGWDAPFNDELPTGKELVENYLLKVADLPQIKSSIQLNTKVISIAETDKETQGILNRKIENLNPVELIDLNKRLLKSVLGNVVDPIEKWADANTVDVIKDMKDSGLENMWIGLDDWQEGFIKPELVKEAEDLGYLIGTYDSYHSIHEPGKEKWETAKFRDTSLYENATVTNKDGNKIEGFQGEGRKLNPTLAMPSVEERITSILDTGLAFNSWFLDTDGTGEIYDDYSPEHITTEKDDIQARIKRMEYLQQEWDMVVGTEGGNDFANKTIAFAHGIETPAFSWMDEDMKTNKESEYYVGRYYSSNGGVPELFSKQIPVKDKYKKLFLDSNYTIPLYKLVYNDSVITTYWWGWGTLKLEDEISNRMLYEILYNVPPLYHIDKNEWKKHKETIVRHSKVWSNFSKKVITEEMTDFKIISDDRLVQMTEYGETLSVVANFSEDEFNYLGETIPEKSLLIIDGKSKSIYTPKN